MQVTAPANPLRGIAIDSAYVASFLEQIPGPGPRGRPLVRRRGDHERRDQGGNVVGLVYVAAFAPDEGEVLGEVEGGSKDSVLNARSSRCSTRPETARTAIEFAIDPAKFHDAFAADLPAKQTAVMAATQRPVAEAAFSEPTGAPAWKNLPSWAVVATGDKAAGADVIRSMAERAGATITEVEGSHVIMISQPQAVADVILRAAAAVDRTATAEGR